jgi:hypothetical protein
MKVTTICAVCQTPVEIPATEVKSRNFCNNDCWRWYPVQESLVRTDPFSVQVYLCAQKMGQRAGKPFPLGDCEALAQAYDFDPSQISLWIRGIGGRRYKKGRRIEHPLEHLEPATMQKLERMTQDLLKQPLRLPLHWKGLLDDWRESDLAPAGAKRFKDKQFRKKHGRRNAKKATKKLRGRKRPDLTARLLAGWADPATKTRWLASMDAKALPVRGKLLTAGVRAGYASFRRSLGHSPTITEREGFMRDYSRRHGKPLDWVRRILERRRGRPKAVDQHDIIRRNTYRGRVNWPGAFREIELLRGRKLNPLEEQNLRRDYRRERQRTP